MLFYVPDNQGFRKKWQKAQHCSSKVTEGVDSLCPGYYQKRGFILLCLPRVLTAQWFWYFSLFLDLHLLLALVLISAIGNFQYWLILQLWEVCFFTEKRFLFPRLPGCFVILCLTLKKKPNTLWTQPSLIFLLQQSDVEVSLESPKPTIFSKSKLTDIFSVFPCILPQQPL